ncbi:MAG: UvrD-helicase domain-containing protein [Bacteroidales bacterium]|nr:UvrD-helicase domain-containing protein [Bacteroidales bacterium]
MDKAAELLSQLNDVQQSAVKQIDGPLMVIAGAGSGKTRVLTYRIAYMLTQGINPFQILALTFTNKAAGEMKERIFKLVGDSNAKAVSMGTFHSIFYRIIRVEGYRLGYNSNLTVYDTDDSKSMIKSIVKEMQLDPKVYVANYILNRISAAKSSLLSDNDYAENPEIQQADASSGKPLIADIFKRYNQRLKIANAMDFDDLLYYMNVLLRDYDEVLFKYQQRFRYILVDEYQDTNFAQYLIIKKLAAANQNICVVGDDAQSIYSFRGADIQNILNFKRDYPTCQIIKLEQNYRSTQNIVNAANAIIKNNKDQLYKEIWTQNGEGQKIQVLKSSSDTEEAFTIANSIFEIKVNEQANHNQFAVLYRTNSQSRAIEEAFIKRHIPYKIYAGLSFYKRKEIKDLMAYFRLAVNHYDEESLRRVINYPQRGIGATTIDKILNCAAEHHDRLWNVITKPDEFQLDVNAPTKARLLDFAARIQSYTALLATTDAFDLAKHIAESSGIVNALKEDPSDKDRIDNIEELLDSIKAFTEREPESTINEATGELISNYFPTLDHYLETVSLLSDDEDKDDDEDKVKLMTIHAAKGLEFDYVFISGMEENLFPSSLCINTRKELEEERRLFYVALTRARKRVMLTYAETRYKFGSLQFAEHSRFLDEIPEQFIHSTKKASAGKGSFSRSEHNTFSTSHSFSTRSNSYSPNSKAVTPKPVIQTKSEVELAQIGELATPEEIVVNKRVYHQKFGYGIVISTDGDGLDKKALVGFETVGNKTLLLKFAKLIIPK